MSGTAGFLAPDGVDLSTGLAQRTLFHKRDDVVLTETGEKEEGKSSPVTIPADHETTAVWQFSAGGLKIQECPSAWKTSSKVESLGKAAGSSLGGCHSMSTSAEGLLLPDICELRVGKVLLALPRWRLGCLTIGPYGSVTWDRHFASTVGFGSILDLEDEVRFDPDTGRIVSLGVYASDRPIPRDDLLLAASRAPVSAGMPTLRPASLQAEMAQFAWIWIDEEGGNLAVWSGASDGGSNVEACEIGRDLRMFWNSEICGLLLHDPVRYLAGGDGGHSVPRQTCRAVAEFVRTITDEFMNVLYDDDQGAMAVLNDMIDRFDRLEEGFAKAEMLDSLRTLRSDNA